MATIRLKLIFLLLFLFVLGLFNHSANAAASGTVTATVTAQNISLTVSDGTVAYGVLAVNTSQSTITLTDTQTVTNNGNVTEDFEIKGMNSAAWTLDSVNTTEDHYVHMFCPGTCSSPPTNYTALTVSYATLNDTGVAVSGTQTVDLQITTPITSTVYTSQSVDVTVLASMH